ncbi:hypothetical protein L5515_006195 [Caenorhabditis briggsae]|uniref:Uncharacterized protein n=1 Tax=Caenorhabditis briggsae TaxID=6238 RepID=A0AAE9JIH0_CAEBR|nr:hypothetical protein L5515_006195 [Caenorhabditis briggsae]
MIALIVTTRKRVLLGTLSMRSDKLVTEYAMMLLVAVLLLLLPFSTWQNHLVVSLQVFKKKVLCAYTKKDKHRK